MKTTLKENESMKRNNTIGIVGEIMAPPELIVDAADWARKIYETKLKRTRPSGTEDIFVLQFDGRATGSEEMLQKIRLGTVVIIGGEIRSENVRDPQPEENRVKVYIYAEVITVNDPPIKDQNEVEICGNICQPPRLRSTHRRSAKGKRAAATSIMVVVNSQSGTNYIPCVCFGWQAFRANLLKVGDYVEIYGRFQSRDYKKRIEGRGVPYLCTVYEVCAFKLKNENRKEKPKKEGETNK